MAKVSRPDGSKVRGKTNKKSDLVHRTRNGAEHQYHMNPYKGPATPAQKAHRALHGKISAILNPLMTNPEQVRLLTQEMENYNREHMFDKFPTVRKYAYNKIRQQLLQQTPQKQQKPTARTPLPRGITLQIKPFAELAAPELYEILKSRFSVFVLEQGIRYLDEDGLDLAATHLSLRNKGQVVAYARLYELPEDNVPVFNTIGVLGPQPRILRAGRMLTTDRGQGYGRILMQHLVAEARRQGAGILRIHAQLTAVPFYRHFRFRMIGEPFIEAGINHVLMERKLTKSVTK